MDSKILIVALLAFCLLLFGCAKGGAASTPSGVTSGIHGAPSSAPSGEETGGTGTPEAGQAGGEETQPEAGAGTQGAGNGSEPDIGDLFNIDTVQPESGSGYDIPAAGE